MRSNYLQLHLNRLHLNCLQFSLCDRIAYGYILIAYGWDWIAYSSIQIAYSLTPIGYVCVSLSHRTKHFYHGESKVSDELPCDAYTAFILYKAF